METKSAATKLGVAIFGVGRVCQVVHLANILSHPKLKVLHIIDAFPEVAQTVLANYDTDLKVDGLESVKAVLDDPNVAAIFVFTPTTQHEANIIDALNNGKHVFVEKPPTGNWRTTEACYALAAKVQKTLFCALNRRHDPTYATLQRHVAAGDIGLAQYANVYLGDYPEIPDSILPGLGSLYLDMCFHGIDVLCWITGQQPDTVFARGAMLTERFKKRNIIENATTILTFPSGLLANITTWRPSSHGYDSKVEIIGTKATITAENQHEQSATIKTLNGKTSSGFQASFPERFKESFKIQLDCFVDTILGNPTNPVPTGAEMVNVLKIVEAMERSDATSQLVRIDEIK